MTTPTLEQKIMRTVSRAHEPPGNAREIEIERSGDVSFDLIVNLLQTHRLEKPGQRMRALSLLALLTRQQCPDRIDEVGRWAAEAAKSDHREERSRGVIMLLHIPRMMRSRGFAIARVDAIAAIANRSIEQASVRGLNATATRAITELK